MKVVVAILAVLVLGAQATEKPKPHEPSMREKHYGARGEHNPDFDSESLFGE